MVEAENYYLKQDLLEAEKYLHYAEGGMHFDSIKNNDKLILLCTGLPNAAIFESALELLKDPNIDYFKRKVDKLPYQIRRF